MKKIAILGSTGSIGTQALDIIEKNPDLYSVTVLSGSKNLKLLSSQIEKFNPIAAVVPDQPAAEILSRQHPKTHFLVGMDGLVDAAATIESELVLNALVGMIGLVPTYEAIKSGKNIALANKETLVAGGELIIKAARDSSVSIYPVDSEHNAIFQCIDGQPEKDVKRLIITASGGPFLGKSMAELGSVKVSEALNHPRWKMGSKISIDSATLMNKGLEVIEARWLFDIPAERIDVVIHPQSIIHSMVEFKDHSILAQLGVADMRIPIGHALSYPERLSNDSESLDLLTAGPLTFLNPDRDTFRCLQFAYDALNEGGSYPIALNAANEVLVGLFIDGKISFLDIQINIERLLQEHNPIYNLSIESILEIDKGVRERVEQICL